MEDSKFERLWAIVGCLFSDRPKSVLGGRPAKHAFKEIVRVICWILDTDLSRSKSWAIIEV